MSDKVRNKKRSSVPAENVTVMLSDSMTLRGGGRWLNVISRYVIALITVLGMCFFVMGCLGVSYPLIDAVICSIFFTSVFFFGFGSFKRFLIGSAVAAGGILAVAATKQTTAIRLILGGGAYVYNRLMSVIDALGFIAGDEIGRGLEFSDGKLIVISMVAAFITCLCIRKRSLFVPFAVAVCFVICPAYYYGMVTKLSSCAIVICGLCGFAAIRISEKHGKEPKTAGVSGAVSLVLAVAIMLPTLATVDKPWKEWESFTPYARVIEKIFLDLSVGRMPTLGWGTSIPDPNESRTAEPSPRIYLGQIMMKVYGNTSTPLYLRTWAGGKYEDDTWYPISVNDKYKQIAREEPYTPLRDMVVAYAAVGIDVLTAMGLRRTSLNVVLQNESPVIPIPDIAENFYNGEGYTVANTTVLDGIFNIGPYGGGYSVDTVTRFWRNEETSEELRELIRGYVQFLSIATGENKSVPRNRYCELLIERNNSSGLRDIIKRYGAYGDYIDSTYPFTSDDPAVTSVILEMFNETDIKEYFSVERNVSYYPALKHGSAGDVVNGSVYLYENGVLNRYYLDSTGVAEAERIANTVAVFLGERCRYDLNPKRSAASAMQSFLYDTREGYCVQFATAGALIMRQLGFISRYAEGYVATDFVKNRSESIKGTFRADVYDRNAHAWTEIWVDGYGWMQLEMTPSYYQLFNPISDVTDTTETTKKDTAVQTTPEPTDTETEPPADTTVTEPVRPTETVNNTDPPAETTERATESVGTGGNGGGSLGAVLKGIGISVLIIIPVAAVICTAKAVGDRRKKRRARLRAAVFGAENSPDSERMAIGRTLTAELAAVLSVYGFTSMEGELPSEFGSRVDHELERLGLPVLPSEALEAAVKQVYGGGMSAKDLATVLNVNDGLRKRARKELGIFKYVINKIKGIL